MASSNSKTAPVFLSLSYAKQDEALLHTNCAAGEVKSDLLVAFEQNGYTLQGELKLLHGGVTRAVLKDDRIQTEMTLARKIEVAARFCQVLSRLSQSGWTIESHSIFINVDQRGTLAMRKVTPNPPSAAFGCLLDSGKEMVLLIPKPFYTEELLAHLREKLELSSSIVVKQTDDPLNICLLFECTRTKDDLSMVVKMYMAMLSVLIGHGFKVDGTYNSIGDDTECLYLSISRSSIPTFPKLFAMTPEGPLVKFMGVPENLKKLILKEMTGWKKSETLWQKRSRQGKRIIMQLLSHLQKHGWTVLCTLDLNNIYKYSVFVFLGIETNLAGSLPTLPMMSISISSPKKLQADFSIKSFYNREKSLEPYIQDVLGAFAASNGIFEHFERVVRYPDGTFSPENPGKTSLIFLHLLIRLYELGWRVLASGNVSGQEGGIGLYQLLTKTPCPHTLFLMHQLPMSAGPEDPRGELTARINSWRAASIDQEDPPVAPDHRRRPSATVMQSNQFQDDEPPSYEEAVRRK